MSDKERINTEGGAVVEGDVHAQRDFVGRDIHETRTTFISGGTLIAVLALLVVGFVAALAILRPNIGWIEGLMPGSQPSATVLSTRSAAVGRETVEKPEFTWIEVPEGEFLFGLSDNGLERTLAECNSIQGQCEKGWFDQEQPQKTLPLARFQIAKYETSNAQYQSCVRSGACEALTEEVQSDLPRKDLYFEADAPVVTVTYAQATAFCQWIGGRLPSEEEWEKAARGEDGRRYPWGDEFEAGRANISSIFPVDPVSARPSPVESYANGSSPYGVLNLSGNVFEWTTSRREGKYLVRGGSWNSPFYRGRVTDRGTILNPDESSYDVGFRCIRY